MTATTHAAVLRPAAGNPTHLQSRAGLFAAQAFALCLFLFPSVLVLPGPLKSNGSPSVLLALLGAIVIAVAFVAGPVGRNCARGPLLIAVTGSLTLVTSASGLVRPLDPTTQAGVVRGLLSLVAYSTVALFVMLWVQAEAARRALVLTIVIGLIYSGVIGFLQGAGIGDYRYLLRPPAFVLNREFEPISRSGFTRAIGTSDSPIEFAVLMACLIALSLYVLTKFDSQFAQAVAVVGVVIGILGVPASVSRTGVVCLGAVLLVYAFVSTLRQIAVMLLATALLISLYVLAVPSRADELLRLFTQASSDDSISGRTDDYSYVLAQFRNAPFFGNGLGTSLPTSTRYLDNQWLQAAVQGGTVGIISLAALFTAAFVLCVSLARNVVLRSEGVAYLSVLAAVFAASFTFDLFAFAQVKYLLFVVLGLAFAAQGSRHDPARTPRRPVSVA